MPSEWNWRDTAPHAIYRHRVAYSQADVGKKRLTSLCPRTAAAMSAVVLSLSLAFTFALASFTRYPTEAAETHTPRQSRTQHSNLNVTSPVLVS